MFFLNLPLQFQTPIQLKRIARKPLTKPETKAQPSEPYIKDSDYENINNIIFMCGTSMEKTARTYYNNQEEELRDILLAALNTHYESATGETFRKIGKTDIQIEFENKAAFIGECKIWGKCRCKYCFVGNVAVIVAVMPM